MRPLILALAGLAAILAATSPVNAAPLPKPVVRTTQGELEGRLANGAYAFLGISYGGDTGGANRFLPPTPAKPWSGVRPALAMGPRCPQPSLKAAAAAIKVIEFSDAPISEDCLVLNVWTPKPGHAKRPVMVWIHGGGFAFGSANDKYYEGTNLARGQDVVVVSMNHRLNGFGYLTLGPEAGDRYKTSGNVGMLDIVQALQWVKANIAAFGGDPDNVTIFGQSGGGGKVSTLLAMPSAHGLFHKAIIESGADLTMPSVAESTAVRDKVLTGLNLKPADVLKLRDMPMDDLITAFNKIGILSYRPTVDGVVLPTNPFDPAAPAMSADIPLMVGTTHDEATALLLTNPAWPATNEAMLQAGATALLGNADKAKAAIALYRQRAPDDKPMYLLASIMTDQSFTKNAIALAERKAAQHAAPVFAYRIDWKSPVMGGMLRAQHGVELPFVFDNAAISGEMVGSGADNAAMTALMGKTFAAFARTGNPNVKGYPHWPAYSAATRDTFIYDIPPHVVADPDAKIRVFLESH